MKKLILAAIAALVCVSAAAQLNVKKSRSATETIVTLRAGHVRLCAADSLIYFVLPSSNQFDDPQLFYLGKTADSAVETLDDLAALLADGDVGSSVDVDQRGRTVTIRVEKQLIDGIDYGYVGAIQEVNPKIICDLLDEDYLKERKPGNCKSAGG